MRRAEHRSGRRQSVVEGERKWRLRLTIMISRQPEPSSSLTDVMASVSMVGRLSQASAPFSPLPLFNCKLHYNYSLFLLFKKCYQNFALFGLEFDQSWFQLKISCHQISTHFAVGLF